jgi:hypothetical protein
MQAKDEGRSDPWKRLAEQFGALQHVSKRNRKKKAVCEAPDFTISGGTFNRGAMIDEACELTRLRG